MAAIETKSLTKRFGDVVAVRNLDLTVEEGEIFGFLGPNGAGKSTTINMLLDFMRPSDGTATVLGYDAQDESRTIRDRIGILPDGYRLYDRLTAREHLEFAIDAKDATNDPAVLIDRVGLSQEDADRKVGGYSKGMTQRLALAAALVGDPDLLILDEPSSGLDPHGIAEMRELLREEADRGTAVFFSSHILSEVDAVCDRVGIMNDGELVAQNTVERLRELTGSRSQLLLSVERVPTGLDLTAIDGVSEVSVEESMLRVSFSDPVTKPQVVKRVDAATTVTDIKSEEASLEELFTTYTTGDEPEDEPDARMEVTA
ncbi:ABC transporter related protein [Haladaptatus paucihalophilus DX253]|uniref:ABC transporter related protein n=1 Tax=Haladaptatus paucihalophilus DX253 TaxID=797209 RepID=E7QTC6_HALPU|nr:MULTISPECIES: ABC transporter ATP-binding protein [Haladaptatus]EFW91855.1 ABC transporter related protein [Haladaptatus paucihalophilus DX253]SHK81250.1 ABC-2 type transport system ATP-binding protein [Haladaptatus paucihalophilus DX253]